MTDEIKKQQQIIEINANSNLSCSEKNQQIQKIMMINYKFDSINYDDNLNKTCEHTTKSCYKLYFSCCNIYDPCKSCHKYRNSCNKQKIIITKITCSNCETEQEPSDTCSKCLIKFSHSYCGICNIWYHKDITHCIDCNDCKPYKKEELHHCDKCKLCVLKNTGIHRCVNYKDNFCVVCNCTVFKSNKIVKTLDCMHLIHKDCYDEMVLHEQFKCPHCKKSMWDMKSKWENIRTNIKFTPLPKDILPILSLDIVNSPYGRFKVITNKKIDSNTFWEGEFIDWKLNSSKYAKGVLNLNQLEKPFIKDIYCNDCNLKSKTNYHFYGLECKPCGSFNTQI